MEKDYRYIVDFLKSYGGKTHHEGEDYSYAQVAYASVKLLGKSIESQLSGFENVKNTRWQNAGNIATYFWWEFRRPKHKDEPFSIGITFFKDFIRVYLDVNDKSLNKLAPLQKEKYLRIFNHSIFKLPQPACDHFYEGMIKKNNYDRIPLDEASLIKAVQSQKYSKITTNIPIEYPDDYSDEQLEQALLKAMKVLIPYYDALWGEQVIPAVDASEQGAISGLTELEIEMVFNEETETAGYAEKFGLIKTRQLNQQVIIDLKKRYNGQCQLCGATVGREFGKNIVEAHHIDYFSKSQNNNRSNIVVLCPNCHSLIHKCNPSYNKEQCSFVFSGGIVKKLLIPGHLKTDK